MNANSHAPEVYPMLLHRSVLTKDKLKIYTPSEVITVEAPRRLLLAVVEFCTGELSLGQIRSKLKAKTATSLDEFIRYLLARGVLVDGGKALIEMWRDLTYDGKHLGQPHPKNKWASLKNRLPTSLPAEARRLKESIKDVFIDQLFLRLSASAFANQGVSEAQLTTLLRAGYGAVPPSSHEPSLNPEKQRRVVPSGGAMYPLTLSLILLRSIGDIEAGVHKVVFDSQGGVGLIRVERDLSMLPKIYHQIPRLTNAAGVVVISANLTKSVAKYRNRTLTLGLLEAGCVLQNLGLAACKIGLGWRPMLEFDFNLLTRLCKLPRSEMVFISGVFGVPEAAAHASKALSYDMSWAEKVAGIDFHIAEASIDVAESTPRKGWGRSTNAELAHDKAVAEAAERYAGVQPLPWTSTSFLELENAIDPRLVVSYAPWQYLRTCFPFRPFDPRRQYHWVESQSLVNGEARLLLAESVLGAPAFEQRYLKMRYTSANSSGCASGLSMAQAYQAATMELIERDAFVRHWFAQRGGYDLPFSSLPRDVQLRLQKIRRAGCAIRVQCLTMGVYPVFMVLTQHDRLHFTSVSAGAALELEAGLESALIETEAAVHYRLAGASNPMPSPATVVTPADHSEIFASKRYFRYADALFHTQGTRKFNDLGKHTLANAQQLYDHMHQSGLQVLGIDLTRPEAPLTFQGRKIYSARVIVPTLIPIAFGAGMMPHGMDAWGHRRARFPHPFP